MGPQGVLLDLSVLFSKVWQTDVDHCNELSVYEIRILQMINEFNHFRLA